MSLRFCASYEKFRGSAFFIPLYGGHRGAYILLTCFPDSVRAVSCLPSYFLWTYGMCQLVVTLIFVVCCMHGSTRTCVLFISAVSLDFQVSSYWFMCYRCIVRLPSCSFVLVLMLCVTWCFVLCALFLLLVLFLYMRLCCVSNGYHCLCLIVVALYFDIIVCYFGFSNTHRWCVALY